MWFSNNPEYNVTMIVTNPADLESDISSQTTNTGTGVYIDPTWRQTTTALTDRLSRSDSIVRPIATQILCIFISSTNKNLRYFGHI